VGVRQSDGVRKRKTVNESSSHRRSQTYCGLDGLRTGPSSSTNVWRPPAYENHDGRATAPPPRFSTRPRSQSPPRRAALLRRTGDFRTGSARGGACSASRRPLIPGAADRTAEPAGQRSAQPVGRTCWTPFHLQKHPRPKRAGAGNRRRGGLTLASSKSVISFPLLDASVAVVPARTALSDPYGRLQSLIGGPRSRSAREY